MKTIGIACCFVGEWPKWGDLFIESCRHNPSIDFYLMTDCVPPHHVPPENVKFVNLDLPGFSALASAKLGIEVSLKRPYKLIDFKPAYGVIFRDYLGSYDFWGYCDLDVAFGDIRKFLTDELLDEYDVIAARRELITGHFTLFRNTDNMTRLYENSRDYKKVFSSNDTFAFDECGWGLHGKLLKGEEFAKVASEAKIDSMMHVIERSPGIRVHRKTICDEHLPFKGENFASFVKEVRWEKGRVVDTPSQRELMYYHLQYLKESPGFYVPVWDEMPDAFLITKRGVYRVGEEGWARRLETEMRRNFYFFSKLTSNGYQTLRRLRRRLLKFLRSKPPA
jgi:hypothetical protein